MNGWSPSPSPSPSVTPVLQLLSDVFVVKMVSLFISSPVSGLSVLEGRHKYGSRGQVLGRGRRQWDRIEGRHRVAVLISPSHQSSGLTSPHRGGDLVDGVAAGRHALEGQRGGDVTAAGRWSTATGRLPCGSGHIGRRGGAVPHVG